MDFKKIELIGFKSFADKQEIQFDNGVTCIVGPNGCGKSNVADAVRWVLGEQSAKTLRGSSMQDVIFNGTQNRKSLSYCEVSLTFDNSKGLFKDLDYSEVVFTRKLFRSGDSEYYINKKPARLRDIIDCLHECGVSKEGYTIIGQGKVSEILSSKPEDRRTIFEEAVGIAKTKAKRLETSRKLDRTRENITRIVDITTELERQLEPLAKQAEKTRTYRSLAEELKYHEVNTYLYKYDNSASVKDKINLRIKGLNEETENRNKELEEAVKSYNLHTREIAEADGYIRQLNDELIDKIQAYERQSGNAKLYDEKISYFRSEISRLENSIKEAKSRIEDYNNKISEKGEQSRLYEKEIGELESKSVEINAKLTEIISAITEGEKMATKAQEAILQSVESIADIRQNIGALSSEKTAISEKQQETLEKVQSLTDKLTSLMTESAMKGSEMSGLDKSLSDLKDRIKDKESDLSGISSYIAELTSKIYSVMQEITTLEANKKFYSNLRDSFEGFQYAVKKLLTESKTNAEIGKRVKGVVANIIKTDAKYDVAIETCIGGAVQNIVTATPEDAQYLISYLKRTEGGRVTFLPITSIKPRYEQSDTRSAMNEKGVLGLANELVEYDDYFDNIVRYLLGNTLIVDNVDNATNIAKKYHFGFKIVTLDGDVIATNGSMTGGSRKQNTSNLLAVDRNITDIDEKLAVKKAETQKLESKKAEMEKQAETCKKELTSMNTELQDLKQQSIALKEKIASIDIQTEDTKKEIESYRDSIASISTRLTEINKAYTDIEQGNEKLEKERASASVDAEKQRSVSDEYTKRRDELIAENTEIQTKKASLRSQINAYTEDCKRMEDEKKSLLKLIDDNTQNIDSDNGIIKSLIAEMEKVSLTEQEQEYINELKSKRDNIENRKNNLNESVKQDVLKRDMLTAEINKLSEKKYGEEVALSRVDSELEFMQQRVWEEYEITYESALPLKDSEYDITVSKTEIDRLKKRISSLGSVNPNAIDEYATLNERYTEMKTQQDDLEKAEADLKSVIDQLTDEMSKTFEEGFAKIRTNFTRIFKELFGGGTADLIIEKGETDDPLEQGIEIVAEPPGKKLQKISLLSGGEMSLTAIAILFSILKLRPMPFVVLDEIEAALDDANVERFARYLKNFSQETQFIVITHKKVTMELGDALYGVTMQEKGVSKIVSVRLADVVDTLGV